MNGKEQRRAMILTAVIEGRLTAGEGAELMSLSGRHERRLRHGFRRDGPAALVHGNRGRLPAHSLDPGLRSRVIALADGVYAGCNDQHLSELLAEREGIQLSRSSVRRILRAAGRKSPQRRRAPRHRSRRERMPRRGCCYRSMAAVTSGWAQTDPGSLSWGRLTTPQAMYPTPSSESRKTPRATSCSCGEVVRRRGVPLAFYSDRHRIFQSEAREPLTLEEELAGKPLPTQVRRVLDELGVTWIGARSPQAKGRVERLWRTLQDRLYQELRLANISTLDQANAALPLSWHGTTLAFVSEPLPRDPRTVASPLELYQPTSLLSLLANH